MDNKNTPPEFERLAAICLCTNVRRASRMITKLYDDFLEPSGLLATQFIVLGAISAQPSIALTPLADKLAMDPTTLARNLKPLERDGFIEVLKGTDRRTRVLKITEQGLQTLARAYPFWEKAHTWMVSQIGEERSRNMVSDWAELVTLASK
jgi:DNA-binding MarR family transcriptional regulator